MAANPSNITGIDDDTHVNEIILKYKPRLKNVQEKLKYLECAALQNNCKITNSKEKYDDDVEFSKIKFSDQDSNDQSNLNYKSINISDLKADKTILANPPSQWSPLNENCFQNNIIKQNKISFEPSEITGRSTLFREPQLTVEDILASSICEDIRRITLNNKENFEISLNSLKTVDSIANNEFQPAELMTSQMLRDELSWENGYLPIPSAEAIAHDIKKHGRVFENKVNESNRSTIDSSNISEIGNYFYKRSDQLDSIINPNILSPPKRNPVKLINDINSFEIENANLEDQQETCTQIKKAGKLSEHSTKLTMTAVENVMKHLNLSKLLNTENKVTEKKYTFLKEIKTSGSNILGKENNPLENNVINDTVTFTESLLDNSCEEKNSYSAHTNLNGADPIRSAKSPSQLFNTFLDENAFNINRTKKRSRSIYSSPTREPLPNINTMSSTIVNDKKHQHFLNVDNDCTNVSSIRSKSITPEKQTQNLILSSLQTCSIKSPHDKSGISLDITAQMDHPILNTSPTTQNKFSLELESNKLKSKSPYKLGTEGNLDPYTAGSLISLKSRCNSQCSTSSEFMHKDGESLPIKATINQCCFGSIKLRTFVKKTIGIRNISIKRLSFKIGIEGPGFQIDNMENNSVVTLQGQECRTISINFCPTVIGAAKGKLNFSSPNEGWPVDKVILLQGYGGHASIKVKEFLKGPIGPPYINMGEVKELSQPLVKTFSICNRGPLSGFAVINLNSNGLKISNLCNCLEIVPKKAFLPPESIVKFRITFRPRRSDIKKILSKISEVMAIANIRIITGDDPSRQRIRNIIKNLNTSKEKTELQEITQSKLAECWSVLSNEITCNELNSFKENSDNALELVNSFRDWEAVITISHCSMDITKNKSSVIFPDFDETILFRTMICANSDSKNALVEPDARDSRFVETCSVRPNYLIFDQSQIFAKKKFTIKSFFKSEQYFEIASNFKNLFNICPKDGQILPEKVIDIEVNLLQNKFLPKDNVCIFIYFENEKINVPILLTEH